MHICLRHTKQYILVPVKAGHAVCDAQALYQYQ